MLHVKGGIGARSLVVFLAVTLSLAACGDDDDGSFFGDDVTMALSEVRLAGAAGTAVRMSGSSPDPSGGPGVAVESLSAAILGGTAQLRLSSNSPFVRAYVSVVGLDGFYLVELPGPATVADLQITLAQNAPSVFECVYRLEEENGAVGDPFGEIIEPIVVGTGDVQVSISWDTLTDVDLHVVEPNGEEIYFGNDISSTGGTLDLDSNAGCALDGVNNENITWASGSAPLGMYTVRVDYWSNCAVQGSTNYTVTARAGGQLIGTFSGSFTAADADQGSVGSGRTIATFNFGG